MLMGVAYTVLLERKLVGRIQNRWGPSRVGPFGLLQPLVDGAKSFLKEDLIPTAVYRPLYLLAPIIALGCALISIARGALRRTRASGPHGFDLFEISERQHRPARHSRHHFHRRLRHRAGRLVVEQQVFAARLAALFGAADQLRTGARSLAGRRGAARRLAQSARDRRAAGHARHSELEHLRRTSSSSPSSFT